MRTTVLLALLLSCKQTTSAPHQQIASTGKFVKIDEKENKILVVDADGKKFPVAVHHVRSNNSKDLVKQEQMSQLGNKFVSPQRLLRWEKMVLTYQDGDKKYTCVVSPAAAKSFHDDDDDEPQVEIDGKTCETDNKLYVFARLCRAKQGKIITDADLTETFYNGYYIRVPPRNFACVIKRNGEEIPIPSYCFIDAYHGNHTMRDVFKDKLPSNGNTVTDEQLIETVFRTVVPTKTPNRSMNYKGKNCTYKIDGKRPKNGGYQYTIGDSKELGEAQTGETQP